ETRSGGGPLTDGADDDAPTAEGLPAEHPASVAATTRAAATSAGECRIRRTTSPLDGAEDRAVEDDRVVRDHRPGRQIGADDRAALADDGRVSDRAAEDHRLLVQRGGV